MIGTKGRFGYRDQVHFVDYFGATIDKIGQPVQKIFKKYARRYHLI
jgi:hypothetical protein